MLRRVRTFAILALPILFGCSRTSTNGDVPAGQAEDDAGSVSRGGHDDVKPDGGEREASTGHEGRCLPRAFLDAVTRPFSCEAKAKIKAKSTTLPFNCHSQGIGLEPSTQRFVMSCMDVGGPGGRLLSFPARANDGGEWLAEDTVEVNVGGGLLHPSAFQINEAGIFPIAMAPSANRGPSEIRLFRAIGDKISGPLATFRHDAAHVGAMAYATLSKDGAARSFLVGCGWDCATFTVWTGAPDGTAFTLASHGPTSSLVAPGIDENVGKYNALYLADLCEDRRPVLVASHDDWIDVWAVDDLASAKPRLQKIVKRKITEDVVRHAGRPIFFEGMTLELDGPKVAIWAAPHDFGTDECPSGTRCAQYVYRCRFGD